MTIPHLTVLVVGATGSIGRLVVEEAVGQGHAVRALVRDPGKARQLVPEVQVAIGDVARPDTLTSAVGGVDAVAFTLGSDGAGKAGAESVDYGGVKNVLVAMGSRSARIALMTAIGVTNRADAYKPQHRGPRLEAPRLAARARQRPGTGRPRRADRSARPGAVGHAARHAGRGEHASQGRAAAGP